MDVLHNQVPEQYLVEANCDKLLQLSFPRGHTVIDFDLSSRWPAFVLDCLFFNHGQAQWSWLSLLFRPGASTDSMMHHYSGWKVYQQKGWKRSLIRAKMFENHLISVSDFGAIRFLWILLRSCQGISRYRPAPLLEYSCQIPVGGMAGRKEVVIHCILGRAGRWELSCPYPKFFNERLAAIIPHQPETERCEEVSCPEPGSRDSLPNAKRVGPIKGTVGHTQHQKDEEDLMVLNIRFIKQESLKNINQSFFWN